MSNAQVLGAIIDQLDDLMLGGPCRHKHTVYKPRKKDTNTPPGYYCEDCGKQLPIPEESDG